MKTTIQRKMIFSAAVIVLGNRRADYERMRGKEGKQAAIQRTTGLTPERRDPER